MHQAISVGNPQPHAQEDKDAQSPPRERNTFNADTYFFKSSWTESASDREFDIIKEAHSRARVYLGDYSRMVTDHLPRVEAAQICSSESTSAIRSLIQQYGGFKDVGEEDLVHRDRVRVQMVSRRLKPVARLEPDEFWKVFWDIVRCLYLLWKIGIAHGDVSLNNMMYYEQDGKLVGVLNDFDLAAIMNVGERSPKKRGFERTGTLPFMALDLLSYPDGQMRRFFRHDLESCMWCMVWQALARKPREWYREEFETILSKKESFLNHIAFDLFESKWEEYFKFLTRWLRSFREDNTARSDSLTELKTIGQKLEASYKADDAREDSDVIRPDAERARNAFEDKRVEALDDISWIDIVVDAALMPENDAPPTSLPDA